MECCCYLSNVQDLSPDWKTLSERRFRNFHRATLFVRGGGRKWRSWKGDQLAAEVEELQENDASEVYFKRTMKTEQVRRLKDGVRPSGSCTISCNISLSFVEKVFEPSWGVHHLDASFSFSFFFKKRNCFDGFFFFVDFSFFFFL